MMQRERINYGKAGSKWGGLRGKFPNGLYGAYRERERIGTGRGTTRGKGLSGGGGNLTNSERKEM